MQTNNLQVAGKIKKVNKRRLTALQRRKLRRIVKPILITGMSATMVLSMFGIESVIDKVTYKSHIPNGYSQIYTYETVDKGETLYDIAKDYYNSDIYSYYYRTLDDFIKEIAKENNLKTNNVGSFQSLKVPALVTNDNIYLQQITTLKEKVAKLPRWVDYTVVGGDTLLGLAFEGAANTNEAYQIKQDIIRTNNLDSELLMEGMNIRIVNPEIGAIEKEIDRLESLLQQSIKINSNEDTSYKAK